MRLLIHLMAVLAAQYSCNSYSERPEENRIIASQVGKINLPEGFQRTTVDTASFAAWLRERRLKADKTVRLYNRTVKRDQSGCFAVLDMKTGDRDLQQCADAIIRLRAEYLFEKKKWDQMFFLSTSNQSLRFKDWCKGVRYRLKAQKLEPYQAVAAKQPDRVLLEQWLEFVFTYAGTWSLQQQLSPKAAGHKLQPGDVIVEGGFPGHAMIVLDVAVNKRGEEYFILAQSYMPAQDMHIVVNDNDPGKSPWYQRVSGSLFTPDWVFKSARFYSWP